MAAEEETADISRYRFNVDQFYKMAEVGILPQEGREELLKGVVWDRSPLVRNRPHPALKGGVTRYLNKIEGLEEEFDAQIHKYTVDEYHVMGETGILTKDDRVELIEGEIVLMPPIGSPHASIVDRITRMFVLGLANYEAIVRVQGPTVLPNNAEPEPDLQVLRETTDFYREGHPSPPDVLLSVEVADPTLRFDRSVKIPLYSLGQIRETWLIDVQAEVVEVYRDPSPTGYSTVSEFRRGEPVSPEAFPEVAFAVDDIFG